MNICEKLLNKTSTLAVIGLGYVGMPLAIEFAKKVNVIGYDKDARKISSYKEGFDVTGEVGNEALKVQTSYFPMMKIFLTKLLSTLWRCPLPLLVTKLPT